MNAVAKDIITESPIAEYRPTEAALADLRQRYATAVFDVRKPSGMVEAKAARAELRKLRVALEAERKVIKEPALERCRQIDGEAKRITAELSALEDPIDAQIKAEETRKEQERQAREEAERRRIAEIQERIAAFGTDAGKVIGQPAVVIRARIDRMVAIEISAKDFDEFVEQALEARTAALGAMEDQLERQQEHEAEQLRIQNERAELEQLRAQQAEAQRVIEENNRRIEDEARAERERQDAEAQAERDRLAREAEEHRQVQIRADEARRQQEEAERLERQRVEDEQRAQARREQDERDEAERRRIEAEAHAVRQERIRLEAEALANVTLHDAAVTASAFLHDMGHGKAQATRMLDAALSRDVVAA